VIRLSTTTSLLITLMVLAAPPAGAQMATTPTRQLPPNSPFNGGVPDGTVSPQPLPLTVGDVIHRALEHNLGVLLSEQSVEHAGGARAIALSQLLPNVAGRVAESRQRNNLEAFGFSGQAFNLPRVVGPFNVFDARLFLTQSVLDLSAINNTRAENHNVAAAQYSSKAARDLVVLVAANIYLETLAADARAASIRAELETSQALFTQAQDLKQNGIIAGIDVLRSEVQLNSDRQRSTGAQNDLEKARLQLARVIGLPVGQTFVLSTALPNVPVPDLTLDAALEQAYKERPDYLASLERVKAAEATRAAMASELLPSVRVTADFGALGLVPSDTVRTYNVTGAVNVPIFQGGRTQGRIAQSDADLRQRRSEAADMKAQIYYDVRSSFLDLQATNEQLQVATRSRELAAEELMQARDRFAAGIANNIEVVQAQESVTSANEQYIDALLGYDVSKAVLARSLGDAEAAVERILGPASGASAP
jgi:outer membrane protein TolC